MSNQNLLKEKPNLSNPFRPIPKEYAPEATVTDYHTENDDYIIDYGEVDHLVKHGDKDTDFTIRTDVEVTSKVKRDDYIKSYSGDVGILNIIEKVRRTGDTTLLHQVESPVLPASGRDAIGRPIQDVLDITPYQVDRMEALNSFKKGAISFKELPDDLKGKLSMDQVARLKDDEIDDYLKNYAAQIKALKRQAEAAKEKEGVVDESSK